MCICASGFHTEGGGGALGFPIPQEFIRMNSTPLGGTRVCICASGFHTGRGGALGFPPTPQEFICMNSTPLGGTKVCICASGFHTGGGALGFPPPPPHINLYTPLGSWGCQNVYLCIRVPYREEGEGVALGSPTPPPPPPHKFIGMNSTPLDVGVPECIFVHQGFIWRGGGGGGGASWDCSPRDRLQQDRQAFPWDCSPGDRLHQYRQAFPWHLSRSYQRTDYIE